MKQFTPKTGINQPIALWIIYITHSNYLSRGITTGYKAKSIRKCLAIPPCHAPSDSCRLNKSIKDPTTSSASSFGKRPVIRPTLQSTETERIHELKNNNIVSSIPHKFRQRNFKHGRVAVLKSQNYRKPIYRCYNSCFVFIEFNTISTVFNQIVLTACSRWLRIFSVFLSPDKITKKIFTAWVKKNCVAEFLMSWPCYSKPTIFTDALVSW